MALSDQRDHVQPEALGGYAKRQQEGLCDRGCGRAATDGNQCAQHGPTERQRKKLAARKRRAAHAKAGECIYCGTKLKAAKGKAPRCAACLIKTDRTPRPVVAKIVATVADFRISAFPGEEGRTRFHGRGTKGQPSVAEQNAGDVKGIEKQVRRAVAALALADGPALDDAPRIQRKEARDAALGEWLLGARAIIEMCVRNRVDVNTAWQYGSDEHPWELRIEATRG